MRSYRTEKVGYSEDVTGLYEILNVKYRIKEKMIVSVKHIFRLYTYFVMRVSTWITT